MKIITSLREALEDDHLLGQAIAGSSWDYWRALLLAIMGEPLTAEELELFASVTGRREQPQERVEEFWGVIGRRSGKTRAIATLCAYLATCVDWSDVLAKGERGVLPVLAASTTQAGRAFMHIAGVLQHSPDLSEMLEGEPTSECIRLSTQVDITVHPANFRTIRSITAVAAVCDELAFWHVEGSKNPDHEILDALRPSLATTEGPLLVISSPYGRKGELWNTYGSDYGETGDPLVLVAKGASKTFNSTLKQRTIDRAYRRNPASASAEFGGEFRVDVESILVREVVQALVEDGITERERAPGVNYSAFVDPAGGSGADSMTLCIAHRGKDGEAIIDAVREKKPPFSPSIVTSEFCTLLKGYGVLRVIGDNFGGEWCKEPFSQHGVTYERCEQSKSVLYAALIPAINSGRASLLDQKTHVDQLVGLERRTGTSGRDIIDHAPGGHDDVANAIAGAVSLVLGKRGPMIISEEAIRQAAIPDRFNRTHVRLGGGLR